MGQAEDLDGYVERQGSLDGYVGWLNSLDHARQVGAVAALTGRRYAEDAVSHVEFVADGVGITVNLREVRLPERIRIDFTVGAEATRLCATCGLTRHDPKASHVAMMGTMGHISVRDDGYYPHVFRESPDA